MDKNFLTVKPTEGLGDILFGFSPDKVKEYLGSPSRIDDEEEGYIIFYYRGIELSLSFDREINCFDSIEAYNEHMTLWGEAIIGLTEDEILKLFSSKGYDDFKIENESDNSKCISYDDLSIFLWFEDWMLDSIQWGVLIDDDDNTLWPTPPENSQGG